MHQDLPPLLGILLQHACSDIHPLLRDRHALRLVVCGVVCYGGFGECGVVLGAVLRVRRGE